ncbi:MAG: CPBP family intramembrane metalloprotease [Rhodobacteraceae bacterium]|nr:MAG: CPBP family intramembrane metalloprotease [Paracoccaceae bacterium]
MSRSPYDPQQSLSAPARATAELWRTGAGTVLGLALYLTLAQGAIAVILTLVPAAGQAGTAAHGLVRLASVGLLAAAVAIAVVALHSRAPRTLLGDPAQALRDFRRVLGPMALLLALTGALQVLLTDSPALPMRDIGSWLVLLPFGLAAVLIQAGSEEIVFRGYLQQQLAARFAWPPLWLGLPSALFAAVHHAPAIYGDNALAIVLWAGVFGVAMGDLTARSGTPGAAIAVHFAMNAWSILAVALPGPLVGLALYVLPFGASDEAAIRALLPLEFAHIALGWLTARLALRV